MKNEEFYKKKIIELFSKDPKTICKFKIKYVLKTENCKGLLCETCRLKCKQWLNEEAEEIDWIKVKVDTPILVSDDNVNWYKKHFAKYKNGKVYVWNYGTTSWSNNSGYVIWNYTKLANEDGYIKK